MSWTRYFHTVRYLKPVQIYGRLRRRITQPKPDFTPAPAIRSRTGDWVSPTRRSPCLIGPTLFRCLNEEHDIASSDAWNNETRAKLWLYHLHYFDDLTAREAERRATWHACLIQRWIRENPPASGNGWEPYPLSLRIVNWIKWAIEGNDLTEDAIHSLAVQTRMLQKRLETHLLGNHLFANAKALVFAGLFFEGRNAEEWLATGLQLISREIPEQILPDGGHFERSPMYHCIILEDMLDLVNISRSYTDAFPTKRHPELAKWPGIIQAMFRWLVVMCHPDGHIALMNDATFDMACSPAELEGYAGRLGIVAPGTGTGPLTYLPDSGYVRMQDDRLVALVDVGVIGPEYLPAHAHADTLSFELSYGTRRLIVDTGVSNYEDGAERLRERSTAAHNTVIIDGMNSSEVWGNFRVARRARPFDIQIKESPGDLWVAGTHDGYHRLSGRPVHRRTFRLRGDCFSLLDEIIGSGIRHVEGFLHFHPAVEVNLLSSNRVELIQGHRRVGMIQFRDWEQIELARSWYAPEFGRREPNSVLKAVYNGALPFRGYIEIRPFPDPL